MSRKTPELWAWWDDGTIESNDGYVVATVQMSKKRRGLDGRTGEGNARLIASAPCLLRALRGIVEAVDPGVRGDTDLEPYFTGPVAAARLAIAQATGDVVAARLAIAQATSQEVKS